MRFIGIFSLILFSVVVPQVQAATLYIDPAIQTLYRGDAVTASVRVMPDQSAGECINVVDAVITYSDNIEPVDVSIGQSILSAWVEIPVIDKANRQITFLGGIPNGYCGRVTGDPALTNNLVDIIFRSPGMVVGGTGFSNEATIGFTAETQVLLNDGLGTRAPLVTLGSTFTLDRAAGAGIVDDWRDQVRQDLITPEEFSITLHREIGVFRDRYFVIFNTTDKQTGLSHYEVMEEPVSEISKFNWGGVEVPWIRASSPYVLKDQSLQSIIRVKAVDKAGNEYVATLIPEESLRTISGRQLAVMAAVSAGVVFSLILVGFVWWWYKRRQKSVVTETVEANVSEHD